MDKKHIGTWIHGIGVTEDLDTSGERIEVDGVDTSTLLLDGVFNWEHKQDTSSQIVGKILEAKKIKTEKDCDNKHHKHFFKINGEKPYLYVAGILYDGFGHNEAANVASMLKFNNLLDPSKTKGTLGYSIEGSRLDKQGSIIKKCIARMFTITKHPANKACCLELLENPEKTKGYELLDKKKLEEIMKNEKCGLDMKKAENKYLKSLSTPKERPTKADYMPQPKSSVGDLKREGSDIKPKRTRDAADIGEKDSLKEGDRIQYRKDKPKTGKDLYSDPDTFKSDKKLKKKKLYSQKEEMKEKPFEKAEDRCWEGYKPAKGKKPYSEGSCVKKGDHKYQSNMRKAIAAGSGMGAPSTKTQGDALQKEGIKHAAKKISQENWKTFEKKEELVKYLEKSFPTMGNSFKNALAKTIAYVHMKKKEMYLKKAMGEDQKLKKASKFDSNLSEEEKKDRRSSGSKMSKPVGEPKGVHGSTPHEDGESNMGYMSRKGTKLQREHGSVKNKVMDKLNPKWNRSLNDTGKDLIDGKYGAKESSKRKRKESEGIKPNLPKSEGESKKYKPEHPRKWYQRQEKIEAKEKADKAQRKKQGRKTKIDEYLDSVDKGK